MKSYIINQLKQIIKLFVAAKSTADKIHVLDKCCAAGGKKTGHTK